MKKNKNIQLSLSGEKPEKKKRNILSEAERNRRIEKEEAHRAFKIYKANSFKPNMLSDRQKELLFIYYKIGGLT